MPEKGKYIWQIVSSSPNLDPIKKLNRLKDYQNFRRKRPFIEKKVFQIRSRNILASKKVRDIAARIAANFLNIYKEVGGGQIMGHEIFF